MWRRAAIGIDSGWSGFPPEFRRIARIGSVFADLYKRATATMLGSWDLDLRGTLLVWPATGGPLGFAPTRK